MFSELLIQPEVVGCALLVPIILMVWRGAIAWRFWLNIASAFFSAGMVVAILSQRSQVEISQRNVILGVVCMYCVFAGVSFLVANNVDKSLKKKVGPQDLKGRRD